MRAAMFWRRLDVEGLERLALSVTPEGIVAHSTLLCLEEGGFRLDYHWRLDPQWRTLSVTVERWTTLDHRTLLVERAGSNWGVDGVERPDLDGAEEADLSVTPFSNMLPIRRLPRTPGETLTLDTAFIDGRTLSVMRSHQRYERQGPRAVRYIDLGLSAGFEADLTLDDSGFIVSYEHLFERILSSRT